MGGDSERSRECFTSFSKTSWKPRAPGGEQKQSSSGNSTCVLRVGTKAPWPEQGAHIGQWADNPAALEGLAQAPRDS